MLAKIREITDGYGCDIYIEATGHHKAVNQGLAMLRKLGRFVEFSVFNDEATVDWSIIGDRKELDVLGSHLGPTCTRAPSTLSATARSTCATSSRTNSPWRSSGGVCRHGAR